MGCALIAQSCRVDKRPNPKQTELVSVPESGPRRTGLLNSAAEALCPGRFGAGFPV